MKKTPDQSNLRKEVLISVPGLRYTLLWQRNLWLLEGESAGYIAFFPARKLGKMRAGAP